MRNRLSKAVVAVVGLGYVGLPLALVFCEAGFKVLGFDIQQKRVDSVNHGKSYIADVSDDRLGRGVDRRRPGRGHAAGRP